MFDGNVDIPCPECNQKTPLSIRAFEADQNPMIVCSGCGKTITLDIDNVRAEFKRLRDAADNLEKALNKGRWKTRKV